MAEYIFINEKNVQGKNTTFNPTNKLPIIGSRIWATLSDLEAYLNDATSSAIAGIQVAVVADPTAANNGTYEIIFKNPALLDSTAPYIGIKDGKAMTPTMSFETEASAQAAVTGGTIDSYRPNIAFFDSNSVSNLTYKKLVNVDNQGGIDAGSVVDGFYKEISSVTRFVYKNGDNYYYYDDQGQQQSYTYDGETVHTYIEFTLTNGDKVRINADELNTYVQNGQLRVDTSQNKTFLDLRYNSNPQAVTAPVSIDVTDLVNEIASITGEATINGTPSYVSVMATTSNGAVTLSSELLHSTVTNTNDTLSGTNGVLTNASLSVIENYIDNYDCGTFTFTTPEP